MGLGSRTARHHESALSVVAGVDSSIHWDFQPGQPVMTVDGFRGVVAAVHDGPIAGTESYIVTLANDMGGGEYSSSQLHAIGDVTGKVHRTAADDYPEMGTVLEDRPDIARNTVLASKTAFDQQQHIEDAERNHAAGTHDAWGRPLKQPYDGHGAFDCNNYGCTEHPTSMYPQEGQPQGTPGWLSHDAGPDAAMRHQVNQAMPRHDTEDANWLLDQQHTGPSHLSAKRPLRVDPKTGLEKCHAKVDGVSDACKHLIGHTQGHELDYDDVVTRYDDAKKTSAIEEHKVKILKRPSRSGGLHQAECRTCDWVGNVTNGTDARSQASDHKANPKTAAADHETVDGTECQEGTEPDLDEHGHLSWNGHSPTADTGEYSMFGSPDVSKQSAFHRGADLMREAAQDNDFRFHVTASWADVRRKAKRIRSEGGVHITLSTEGMVIAEVKGDTNVYEAGLQKMPAKQSIQAWSCGCKWGAYHWGADDDFSRFAGRMCSHALALHYEAQSRGMFGRTVSADDSKPLWAPRHVVVKYDIDRDRNVRAPATTSPGDYGRIASLSPISLVLIASAREHTLAATAVAMETLGFTEQYVSPPMLAHLAAVNNAWGEPAPKEFTPLPGPTMPPDKQANPAQTGWADSPDPVSWDQAVPDNQVDRMTASLATDDAVFEPEPMQREAILPLLVRAAPAVVKAVAPTLIGNALEKHEQGAQADLHDDPEPALPSTDGSDAAQDPFGAAGDIGDPTSLEPEDPSFVSTGSLEDAESVTDIVAQFQATAGAAQLQGGSADGGEIAAKAMETLAKQALKDFTPGEQHQIISEGENARAANFDRLDIKGTHYEHLEAALKAVEDEEDDGGWLS